MRERTRNVVLPLAAVLTVLWAAPVLSQVHATIGLNEDRLQGAHANGEVLLYTPDPVERGSSVSHWDTSASPNLLMEPSINPDLGFLDLDLTPEQMRDIGWSPGTSVFHVTSLDDPGVGFTDPRPFSGAPDNPATTLGEARINLFNEVLAAWALTLHSNVQIDVMVTWTPLDCSPTGGAALAGALSGFIFADDSELPKSGTWYHSALAESLIGANLTGDPLSGNPDEGADIEVFVNSAIDDECLGPGTGFYYGLDGNNPSNLIDAAPTVLHEIGHGLGFANFTDERTGAFFQPPGGPSYPSIYDHYTFDTEAGKTFAQLRRDQDRVAAAVNFRKVTWSGPEVTAAAPGLLDEGTLELTVDSPAEVAGSYEIGTADDFGPEIPASGISGEIVCMEDDEAVPSPFDACSAATNPGEIAGKIALVDRGECFFADKAHNAQNAGAIAVIIVNNQGNTPIGLGGDDPTIIIPAISLGQDDGATLRAAACGDDSAAASLRGGRFVVTGEWRSNDDSGAARAVELTDDSAYFYFFGPNNVEVVFKVLNGCDKGGHFWFFAAGLTNVEVTITVTDTQAGVTEIYKNPLNTAFQPIQDTKAFATCP